MELLHQSGSAENVLNTEEKSVINEMQQDQILEEEALEQRVHVTPEEPVTEPPKEDISETVSLLLEEIQSERALLKEQIVALNERNKVLENKLDEKQDKLEHINQKVQEDRFLKEKTPFIMRIIRLLDNIRAVEYKYGVEHEQMTDEEQFLYKQLTEIITAIESVLINEGVVIRTLGNDMVNSEYEETVQLIETTDPSLDNTIARVVSPAYIWTLPYILKAKINESGEEIRSYKFILQAQKIITYKYAK